jgi:NAD(P)-dependent dehydrogenase (short-subunit alcohol dehydrogenase family)
MRALGGGETPTIPSRTTAEDAVNRAAHTMSKATLGSLALEEQLHGMRVNTVAPGSVGTETGRAAARDRYGVGNLAAIEPPAPCGRFCTPVDIANVVRFLASPAASYIAGQQIGVDGGGTSDLFRAARGARRHEGVQS